MLDIEKSESNGLTRLRLIGEADVAGGHKLSPVAINLAAARPARLLVDLSQLTFLSSLAIGELAALAGALQRHGGRVALAGADRNIASALERVRLGDVLELYTTVDEATVALNA